MLLHYGCNGVAMVLHYPSFATRGLWFCACNASNCFPSLPKNLSVFGREGRDGGVPRPWASPRAELYRPVRAQMRLSAKRKAQAGATPVPGQAIQAYNRITTFNS